MRTQFPSPDQLSNSDLVAQLKRLLGNEREATARFVAYLGEVDERRLYLAEGYSSLFRYCTGALAMSEDETFFRIHAARVARSFPVILDMLAAGAIHLTTVRLISSHLTAENESELLSAVSGKSKRDVEHYLAARFPQPGPSDSVRKLPVPKLAAPAPLAPLSNTPATVQTAALEPPSQTPRRHTVVAPVSAERYKIIFTIDAATRAKLQKARDLLRHAVPSGDLAEVFDRALTLLVADLERKKHGKTDRPQPPRESSARSRHVPAAVRRAVWRRDGGQCAFVGTAGRCDSRSFLQYHHVTPYAVGGEATVESIELRCAAHNRHDWDVFVEGHKAGGTVASCGYESPGRSGPSLVTGASAPSTGRPQHFGERASAE